MSVKRPPDNRALFMFQIIGVFLLGLGLLALLEGDSFNALNRIVSGILMLVAVILIKKSKR